MKKIVVYGAGAYAKVFYNEVRRTNALEIAAFTIDNAYIGDCKTLFGLPILPFEDCVHYFPPEEYDMIVLCGYTKMRDRKIMFDKAKEKGYFLSNYISPDAYMEENITMGENNIIFSNAFVGYGGTMGDGNVIRQNVYLGHNFQIGDHNIISSGVTIGGNLKMRNLSFIALGVTIVDSGNIGNECLIGAGSVVVKPVLEYSKYYGNPAKLISKHYETGVIV